MPGGKNPYTRPANKKERAALKRESARNKALENLKELSYDAVGDDDKFNQLRIMMGKIRRGDSSMEDFETLSRGKRRQTERENNMYKMKSGGKVKKTADGCAIKGKTRLAMKGYGKVG